MSSCLHAIYVLSRAHRMLPFPSLPSSSVRTRRLSSRQFIVGDVDWPWPWNPPTSSSCHLSCCCSHSGTTCGRRRGWSMEAASILSPCLEEERASGRHQTMAWVQTEPLWAPAHSSATPWEISRGKTRKLFPTFCYCKGMPPPGAGLASYVAKIS